MAYIGTLPNKGQNRNLDDISSSFNGSTTTFDLQVDSQNVFPGIATSLLLSVGGVIQEPGTAFTLGANGRQITFTAAPESDDDFFGVVLGAAIDVGTPADASVTTATLANRAVTQAKLAENSVGGSKVRANVLSSGSIYTANIAGNAYVTRGFAVGYTDGRVPQANLDVKNNVYIGGATTIAGAATLSSTADVTGKLSATSVTPAFYGANVTGNVSATRSVAVGYTDGRVPQANLEVRGNVFIVPGNPPARATATPVSVTNTGNVGIGISGPTVQVSISNSAAATIHALTDAAEIALDFGAGQNFSVTLGGNRTLKNPVGIVPGQCGSIFVKQDGTGSRTLAYQNFWLFKDGTAPTLTTSANANDRIDYITISSTAIQAVATTALNPS